jgi:hypothetical protein
MTTVFAVLLRAAPWPAIAGISGASLVSGVGSLFLPRPGLGPVVLTVALALLAAAGAFTLDEAAVEVVDVTPLGRPRYTAVRAVTLILPGGAGLAVVLAAAGQDAGWPVGLIGLAAAGNVLLGFALASVGRRHVGQPGPATASAIVLVLVTLSLFRPFTRYVAAAGDGEPAAVVSWAVVAGVSAAVVVAAARADRPAR